MIKKIVIALFLTFPIYAFVVGGDLVTAWFVYGNGWDVFEPVFKMLERLGFSGEGSALYIIMLFISFIISLIVVFALSAWLTHRHKNSV
ncbi:Uncharacterised protein [Serratia ficaria]|uniref:hypothetical protein n=1 Tax=Serratia ficaria TaxID=61651 RepID=UPI0021827928|nr:hypothetical protein [Serratia ficaria]CAI2470218.1 Uncharacterised protein [Serratia ficaria]